MAIINEEVRKNLQRAAELEEQKRTENEGDLSQEAIQAKGLQQRSEAKQAGLKNEKD